MPPFALLLALAAGQAPPAPRAYAVDLPVTWAGDAVEFTVRTPRGSESFAVDARTGARRKAAPFVGPPEPPARRGRPRREATPAFVRDHNLWLRGPAGESQLTRDGTAANAYTDVFPSPDGKRLVAYRTEAGGDRRVTLVASSPKDQLQPRVDGYDYLKPGDKIPHPRAKLFDLESKREIPVSEELFPNPWSLSREQWSADGRTFFCVYNQRGHGVMRVLAVDAATGAVRAVVNEEVPTFFDYSGKLFVRHLEATNELLWMSERSGWNHLYRVDRATGKAAAVTSGEWNVRGVEFVDEEAGEITFRAVGLAPGQDPYHVHFARVKLDGTGLTRLTDGDGSHVAQFSPDRRYFVDSWSRVDKPPVHELRDARDGRLIGELARADVSELERAGQRTPERFAAPGRDGKTMMYGVVIRPKDFDPAKKYPVIEHIYAGPHDHHVPKRYVPRWGEQSLADRGFVVVKLDGMGTNWRSKAFHDVCWKNLGDSGFPDRVAWIKAAANKFPEMDLSRGAGIYGGSAGGQSAVRALTEHGDFYKAAVADCGCHDNRMDKIWWNELWMSWPVGPHYAAQSNVTNAHKITGKLLLVVGELDRNVDPSSTLQVVNALIRADRDFDFLLIPNAGHGAAESPYGRRRREEFFVRAFGR